MFRSTRQTNDVLGWLTLAACALAAAVGAVGLWAGAAAGSAGLAAAAGLWLAAVVPLGAYAGWRVLRPVELEFVCDGGVARWGRAGRPDRQQRLPLAGIRRVLVDDRERKVLVDTGGVALTDLGGDTLVRWEDKRAAVEYLRRHHPEVPVTEVAQLAAAEPHYGLNHLNKNNESGPAAG